MGRILRLFGNRLSEIRFQLKDNMAKAIQIIKRLREPSTWAGIAALGLIVGLPAGTLDALGQVLGAVAAVAAIALPESKAAE